MPGYLASGQCFGTVFQAMSYWLNAWNYAQPVGQGLRMQSRPCVEGQTCVDYAAMTDPAPIEVPITWRAMPAGASVNGSVVLQPCEFSADRLPGVDASSYLGLVAAVTSAALTGFVWRAFVRALL